jgi:hypothetical protein
MFKQKLRVIGLIPILSIIILLGFTLPTKAAQFETGNDYTLTETEIVEENLYIEGQVVEIAGVVDGDLLIGGETVTISGTVTGDVYIAANRIDISGNIYGSTFLAGSNVSISGSVARNSYIASMYTDISGSVGKDLTVFTADNSITGRVTEDVRVFSSRSNISGTVKGEALVFAGKSTINQELVEGEIYENIGKGEEKTKRDIKVNVPKSNIGDVVRKGFFGINVFSTLIGFVAMYIVGIVLIYIAPVKTLQIEKKVIGSVQDFLFSFLIGLGIVVLIPLPLILLSITLIGGPLAMLIGSVIIFLTIFGTVWVESAIGYKILSTTEKKDPKRLLSLLVGRGLTTVVNFIPIVRGLYKTTLSMVALGAVVRMKYDSFKVKKSTKKKSKSKK